MQPASHRGLFTLCCSTVASSTLPAHPPAPARRRTWLVPALKVLVSVGLLALLLSRVDAGRLWTAAREAAPAWLLAGVGLYYVMILVSAWRWDLLLRAQHIRVPFRHLTNTFLVATFFNNFLPSNIGGDVVRIADTSTAAGSKTRATTIVLIDRGLGLLGLVLVAALGASAVARSGALGIAPGLLWTGLGLAAMFATPALLMPERFTRLLQPLRRIHPEWVGLRLDRLRDALTKFRDAPSALATCFAGAVVVQGVLIAFYLTIARSMEIPIAFADLAVIVPITFLVQMVPISMNGFGVRETTFGFYFTRLGLPLESALLISLIGAGVVLLVSLSGGFLYLLRVRRGGTTAPGPAAPDPDDSPPCLPDPR